MDQPVLGSRSRIFRISRSRVPCKSADGLLTDGSFSYSGNRHMSVTSLYVDRGDWLDGCVGAPGRRVRSNAPHPTYRAYRLRAMPVSLVPLIIARPSGKTVIS